jgi:TorA maturation chaperone TorD
MNKIVTALVVCLLVAMGYVFYQYQEIASQADAQVEKDIQFLEASFRDRSSESLSGVHEQEKYVQSALVLQSVNEAQQFVRHYHSLFIENGARNCLLTKIIYLQKQTTLYEQVWLEDGQMCLP